MTRKVSMMRGIDLTPMERLDLDLVQWGKELGPGYAESLSYPGTNILHPSHGAHTGFGRVEGKTLSDEIEGIVRNMEASQFIKHALVLRCNYFHPNWTMEMRLDWLLSKSVKSSRRGYFDYLAPAKMYVLGGLHKMKKSA